MGKTITFYNLAIFKNGEKTDIDMLQFLDSIATDSWENRVRNIKNQVTAMFPIFLNDDYMNRRIIPIGLFRRDYKPFIGDIKSATLKPISNDVVEVATMMYDHQFKTAVIDFNLYTREAAIEEYLSSFIVKREGEAWQVKLLPIISYKGKEDIYKSRQIKYIEIKLKMDTYNQNLINQGTYFEPNKSILGLFNSVEETSADLDANLLKLQFGVGNGKNVTINSETLERLLNILNIDHECIESFRVRYREAKNDELDTIDLKHIGQPVRDRILEDSQIPNPSSQFIGDNMIELYNTYTSTLVDNHGNFISDMVHEELPGLQYVPREENVIKE